MRDADDVSGCANGDGIVLLVSSELLLVSIVCKELFRREQANTVLTRISIRSHYSNSSRAQHDWCKIAY